MQVNVDIDVNQIALQERSPKSSKLQSSLHRPRTQTYDPKKCPPDLLFAQRHGKAKRVYLSKQDDRFDEEGRDVCDCCVLPIEGENVPLCAGLDKIYHLGSGFALYFQFIKYSIALLVLFLAAGGIFNIVTNSIGDDCAQTDEGVESAYCVKGYILSYTLPNKRDDEQMLRIQLYLNLATVVLVTLFFHFMRYSFRKTIVAADDKTTTPSDYTIVIEGLPENTSNKSIEDWLNKLNVAKSSLHILRIIRPFKLGPYLTLAAKHHDLVEADAKIHQANHQPDHQASPSHAKAEQKKEEDMQKELKDTEKLMEQIKKEGLKECCIAYITFERAQHARLVLDRFNVSLMTQIFGFLLSPFVKSLNDFNGKKVQVKRAPEPTDIMWENLEYTQKQRSRSQFFTNTITCILVILSFGLILLLNWAQAKSVDFYGKGSIVVQILSIVTSLIIAITNFIMGLSINTLTKYEKHLTFTNYLRGVAQKLAAAQFINTALTNLFAEIILSTEDETHTRLQAVNLYGKGGLLENMFWVFIISAIQGPALIIFDVGYFIKLFKQSGLAKAVKQKRELKLDQERANQIHEGSQIPMPARFAALIKVMLLTTFYAPAIPIAAVFTIGGLILWYWAEKYNLLRRSVLPPSLDDELTGSMVEYLEWAACTFAVGNIIYVLSLTNEHDQFAFPKESHIIVWITFGISLFHMLFPMGLLNETLFPIKDEVTEHQTFDQARLEFQTDYDIENPVTRKKALKAYFKRLYKAKTEFKSEENIVNKGIFTRLNDINDLLQLSGQKNLLTENRKQSESDNEESLDFDFLDLYANKVRKNNNQPEQPKKAGNNNHNNDKDLAKMLNLNQLSAADNLAALSKLFPGIREDSPDDEPSVHKEHLETETIKPSIQGTRAREYALTDSPNTKGADKTDRGMNDTMSSPSGEALMNKKPTPGLDFFISPLTGKSNKSHGSAGLGHESENDNKRIFLFRDQSIKDETNNPHDRDI